MSSSTKLLEEDEVSSFFYPTTWPIETIQPKLHIYRRDRDKFIIPCDISAKDAIRLLNENDYLSSISQVTFIVHGFRNTVDTEWIVRMKDSILDQFDQLVILVSWGNGSNLLAIYYLQAAANIQAVGEWLANYANEIMTVKPEIMQYAVGHSLGAHLIGIAGRKSGAFNRISALDPAGPAFEHGEFLQYRLRSSDATDLVDVIHTDGFHSKLDPTDWLAPVNHYGTLIPLGTLDFYPNFGYSQPGAGEFQVAGSHTRAIDYFIWSISHRSRFQTNMILDGVPAFETPVKNVTKVDLTAEMGYFANENSKTGLFYIATNKSPPWIGKVDEESICSIS